MFVSCDVDVDVFNIRMSVQPNPHSSISYNTSNMAAQELRQRGFDREEIFALAWFRLQWFLEFVEEVADQSIEVGCVGAWFAVVHPGVWRAWSSDCRSGWPPGWGSACAWGDIGGQFLFEKCVKHLRGSSPLTHC